MNYSIIIPHKNIPKLLERCLASIPVREDLEVIVVDDSSDPKIVDFAHFPGHGRPNTEVIFHKSTIGGVGGVGYARNCALDVAKGKWIIFVDADDMLTPEANQLLDKYRDSDADIVFLGNEMVFCESLLPVPESVFKIYQMDHINNYLTTGDDGGLRYLMFAPWGKLIKRKFLENNNIRFSEVKCCEDMIVAIKTGHLAKKIECNATPFYIYTRRDDSLSAPQNYTLDVEFIKLGEDIKVFRFLHSVGKTNRFNSYSMPIPRMWKHLMRRDRKRAKPYFELFADLFPAGEMRRLKRKMMFDPIVAPFRKLARMFK